MELSCRQKNSQPWARGIVIVSALFSLSVIALWVVAVGDSNRVVAFIGAGYALCCFAFLVVQLVAFVKAHADYDQGIEQPKFDLLQVEGSEWVEPS